MYIIITDCIIMCICTSMMLIMSFLLNTNHVQKRCYTRRKKSYSFTNAFFLANIDSYSIFPRELRTGNVSCVTFWPIFLIMHRYLLGEWLIFLKEKYISEFNNKRFMIDEMIKQNVSKICHTSFGILRILVEVFIFHFVLIHVFSSMHVHKSGNLCR